MITDPIANALCAISNAIKSRKKTVSFYSSKLLLAILKIMKDEGYIIDYINKTFENGVSYVTVYLKYKSGVSAIRGLKRVSKPGYRVYCKNKNLPIIMNGMGTVIISSSQGVICEKTSKKLNVGGEIIAYIW
ncbi:30S ribosomal protein S8 [Candidatus Mycoplasma haematohominis]|uniref:Small ribosomal subunit protein uS8 n=1 Tax=Candidatus Mycoplasma haematohominis TaxID=1494318 RepID=A0A478FR43_9MOLU|nr:30S ribosomal protein S8 [Candidatus Mycoplasma haemohominis]GCE63963.1 30S ribosomal protein S8 [Candidatus Mycoplasma haemohominis]